MALPITILLPTRNSMTLLPEHIENLQPLLPKVEAVIQVDSESSDGTVEFVRERVRHPNFRFLDHPPGLYQSWNFGVQQVQTPYVYVSTVGDTMAPEGLTRLRDAIERLGADVLVSVPRFMGADGKPAEIFWPAH